MDPNLAWRIALESISDEDWETAQRTLEGLEEWFERDGFVPLSLGWMNCQSAGVLVKRLLALVNAVE